MGYGVGVTWGWGKWLGSYHQFLQYFSRWTETPRIPQPANNILVAKVEKCWAIVCGTFYCRSLLYNIHLLRKKGNSVQYNIDYTHSRSKINSHSKDLFYFKIQLSVTSTLCWITIPSLLTLRDHCGPTQVLARPGILLPWGLDYTEHPPTLLLNANCLSRSSYCCLAVNYSSSPCLGDLINKMHTACILLFGCYVFILVNYVERQLPCQGALAKQGAGLQGFARAARLMKLNKAAGGVGLSEPIRLPFWSG